MDLCETAFTLESYEKRRNKAKQNAIIFGNELATFLAAPQGQYPPNSTAKPQRHSGKRFEAQRSAVLWGAEALARAAAGNLKKKKRRPEK